MGKLEPVTLVHFANTTRLPGYPGACTRATINKDASPGVGQNCHYVKSLHILGDRLIVDGKLFFSISGPAILCWEY